MARVRLLFSCLAFLLVGSIAAAEKRVALVIGNSAYKHAPALINPKNDAQGIASALTRLKFDVTLGIDLDKAGLQTALRTFARNLDGSTVALIFFAGHGLQVSGENYVLPVDAKIEQEADLRWEAVSLASLMQDMEQVQRTNIVILDACRDNPFTRSLASKMGVRSTAVGRGLAPVQSSTGTMIVFATGPGTTAADGDGAKNSPFTAALLENIESPGLEIRQILTRVRVTVARATSNKQVPWVTESLLGDFFFAGAAGPSQRPPSTSPDQESIYWQTIRDSKNIADFSEYLRRWPDGTFAALAKRRITELEKDSSTVLNCALLNDAEKLLGAGQRPEALRVLREAGEQCPSARERIAAFHYIASLMSNAKDYTAMEGAIEAARKIISEKFGDDDLAMATNRQHYAMARLSQNDREAAATANAIAARIRNTKVDAWDTSEGPTGAVGHKSTGIRLPFKAGSLFQFRRDVNNNEGTDVSLGYRTTRTVAAGITVFIAPLSGDFATTYARERSIITAINSKAVLKREETKVLNTRAGRIEGRLARFEYTAQGKIGTRLYLFPLNSHYVKLRVTYPIEDEAGTDADVTALLSAFVWPKRQ